VDIVVERGSDLVAIEMKAATSPRVSDASRLRALRDEYGKAVRGCLLLHGGDRLEWLAPGILAAPWWRMV
jgi:hypothetical protein